AIVDIGCLQHNRMVYVERILDQVPLLLVPNGRVFAMMIARGSYGDGTGTEVEPGTFTSVTEGPAQGVGLCHFFSLEEMEALFSRFRDAHIECSARSLNGRRHWVKHWVVDAVSRRPVPESLSVPTALLRLMREHGVRQIPILDGDRRVIDLVTSEDLLPDRFLPLQAVVMAGGFGTRLSPLTEELPKPMLPIDGRPLLEVIIRQLRETGVQRVSITTHYRSAKISEYFGDGRAFGVELTYINEEEPLGTAGALALLGSSEEPLL